MQEQLPLRPAEFVKIRDGFIAFLKQPAGTPIEQVIPQEVLDAMASAARRGRKRRVMLDAVRGVSILVGMAGAVVGVFVDPLGIGALMLLVSGGAFTWAHNRSKVRIEPEIDELVKEPNKPVRRNLQALDDFKNLIASGEIVCEERLPDGTLKPVSARALTAFLADHGALFILSRDQALWQCSPHRPIPMSALWVRLGGRVAPVFVTSRTLLDTPDHALFERRVEWLLSQADKAGSKANSFREAVQIIIALRRPDLEGTTFERKKEVLRAEGMTDSRMEKIHAGVYPPFNSFLRTLPLHEFP
jgi:hypothetical protein